MTRLSRILAFGAAFTVLSAVVAGAVPLGTPEVQPSAASPSAASVELAPKVSLEVSALRRLGDKGVLQAEFTVTNRSDLAVTLYNLGLADNYGITGFTLVDFANKRRYSMGSANSACLCSRFGNLGPVAPGESKTYWAWFALPPADVQQMSVLVPDRSPILNVQVQ
jgi:hypothetical protein